MFTFVAQPVGFEPTNLPGRNRMSVHLTSAAYSVIFLSARYFGTFYHFIDMLLFLFRSDCNTRI